MNKFVKSLILSFVILMAVVQPTLAQTPTPTSTSTSVNSFDMFWPVVAGKVSGDSMYGLKLFKENARETLIFSDYRKADYNITLSTKRAVEAEKLYLTDKNYNEAKKTLTMAQQKRTRVMELIKKASDKGQKVEDLNNTFIAILEKQITLMNYIVAQVPDVEKEAIDSDIKSMQELLAKLQ